MKKNANTFGKKICRPEGVGVITIVKNVDYTDNLMKLLFDLSCIYSFFPFSINSDLFAVSIKNKAARAPPAKGPKIYNARSSVTP